MRPTVLRGVAVACAAAVPLLFAAFPQGQRQSGPTTIASWSISPSVVATFIAHGDMQLLEQIRERAAARQHPVTPPGPVTLDVLILWRGSPGWFAHGGQHESGGGDSNGDITVHLDRGGIALDAALDTEKRVLRIGRTRLALRDANVVMVDGVDVPGGLSIAGTRTVDSHVQRPPEGLYEVFRGAPDLIPFLRCEAGLPGVTPARSDPSCARIIQGQ